MTIYDALMLGLIVCGVIWGAWRGLIAQVASLSSLVLGYVVAEPASEHLTPYMPGEPIVARVLAMLAIYVLATVGIFFVAGLARAALKTLKLGAVDRQLGMMLGAIEGCVVGLVATLFVVSLAPETRTPIFASPTGRIVGRMMDSVGPGLPGEVREVLAPFWKNVPPAEDDSLLADVKRALKRDVESEEQSDGDRPASRTRRAAGSETERLGRRLNEGDSANDRSRRR